MRRIGSFGLAAVLAAGLGTAAPVAAQEQPVRVAVVDMDRVVAQSKRGQELQSRLETLERDARADLERLKAEADDLRRQISVGAATLPEEELSSLQKQFEDATIALRRRQEDAQRQADKMQNEVLERIRRELEPVLVKIREEEGYDLLLNNVPGVVVMVTKRIDITEKVLTRLNEAETAGGG